MSTQRRKAMEYIKDKVITFDIAKGLITRSLLCHIPIFILEYCYFYTYQINTVLFSTILGLPMLLITIYLQKTLPTAPERNQEFIFNVLLGLFSFTTVLFNKMMLQFSVNVFLSFVCTVIACHTYLKEIKVNDYSRQFVVLRSIFYSLIGVNFFSLFTGDANVLFSKSILIANISIVFIAYNVSMRVGELWEDIVLKVAPQNEAFLMNELFRCYTIYVSIQIGLYYGIVLLYLAIYDPTALSDAWRLGLF